MCVTIKLELNGHCIETAAKKKLQQLLNAMIHSDPEDPNLQAQYQLLYNFLHTTDFKHLRASDERFTGIVPSVCEIYVDDMGNYAAKII